MSDASDMSHAESKANLGDKGAYLSTPGEGELGEQGKQGSKRKLGRRGRETSGDIGGRKGGMRANKGVIDDIMRKLNDSVMKSDIQKM